MCKCRICDCWYINCCKSFVGQGCFCLFCATICWNSPTNMMKPKCECLCVSCFIGRFLGCGQLNLGISQVCCVPLEFDDEFAEKEINRLTNSLRQGTVKRDIGGGVVTEQRVYNY